MNNTERAEWIDNDEGLYRWWKSERGSKAKFISDHKVEVDAYIEHEQHKHNGNGGTNCYPSCPYWRR